MKRLENVDIKFLNKYLRKGARRSAHTEAVNIFNHLSFHIDGYQYQQEPANPYFRLLIDDRRPSESATIKEYRRKIFISNTKATCFKVINSLKKIVKSNDWKIDYSKSTTPPRIPEDETLEKYCEGDYPIFKTIVNWMYSYGMKEILTDPNGAVVVLPRTFDVKPNEFLDPYASYVCTKNIFDYKQDHYIVYESDMMSEFSVGEDTHKAPIIVIMDTYSVWFAKKISQNADYNIEHAYDHKLGYLPAFLGGGIYKTIVDETPLFDSFMSPMLPSLDVASREGSDLDAEVVQHIYSTQWYMGGENCGSCSGVGKVKKEGKQVVCPSCKGVGVQQKSPYKDLVIKKGMFEQGNIPTPPAGYITKPTDMVKLQDDRIRNHLTSALSSINMEFLATTPLNQSGTAKEVDRDELNNFVYGVAYHLVENVLKPIYKMTVDWRYMELIPSEKARHEMLPRIVIPEKFDLLSEDMMLDNISKAQSSEVDAVIIAEMQTDYINKKFRESPEVRDKLVATNELNPFVGVTSQEINDMLLAGIITKKDAVKSTYINEFLDLSVAKDDKFLQKSFEEKMKVIDAMADEKIKLLSPVMTELSGISDMGGLNEFDAEGNQIETPVDVEAEAKARLKGSVGGVQGIIGINQAVGMGEMAVSSAKALLVEIYGFDPATATALIQAPKMKKEADVKAIAPVIPKNG